MTRKEVAIIKNKSEKQRKAVSIAMSKRKISQQTREKMRKSRLGKKLSGETKRKISEALRGAKSHLWKGGVMATRSFYERMRNIRKRNAPGSHTFGEWETLKIQYNLTCPNCLRKEPKIKLTEDHIIPLSRGGSNNIENIQPLCRSCNSRKGVKII